MDTGRRDSTAWAINVAPGRRCTSFMNVSNPHLGQEHKPLLLQHFKLLQYNLVPNPAESGTDSGLWRDGDVGGLWPVVSLFARNSGCYRTARPMCPFVGWYGQIDLLLML